MANRVKAMLQLNTEHKACPRRSLHDPGEAFSYYLAWHQSAYIGVLRLVGALDFTGGVGRETYRQIKANVVALGRITPVA